MKATILYESEEKAISSERFLSKEELRAIFGSGITISLIITRHRKRFSVSHSKDHPAHLKAEVFSQKSREIHL
jgi:hypothetical protein